ncbi:MAG TPA: DJ-1/PfpI family protein [Anaerovoracaceae bacterium]|nr:DJ-1/PfpI family protein [Anaerovoracaceae bacterium]
MYNVGIFLFHNVELLDFAGPHEVFSVTSELNNYELMNIFTVSAEGTPIRTVNKLMVLPDYSFENHPSIDILVVPGGVGTKAEINNSLTLSWVKKASRTSKITMSVCSGARILGKLGLLDNVESITHHEVIEELSSIAPNTRIASGKRYVDNGSIMTSGGISAGIDLSLHVVEKLFGKEISYKTAAYMEYGEWETLPE